jgi:chaperonin GroES
MNTSEETKGDLKKNTIHPLGDRVLLEQLSDDETSMKSAAGIIIPETVDKEKPMQGRVIAVGAGRYDENGKRVPMQVAAGDRVVFSKYSPDEIKIDGKEYYILSESSILAVIK